MCSSSRQRGPRETVTYASVSLLSDGPGAEQRPQQVLLRRPSMLRMAKFFGDIEMRDMRPCHGAKHDLRRMLSTGYEPVFC